MLLHSETLYNALHRSFYKVKPLRRAAFEHRCFYTRTLLRREDFTLKLNREASAHRSRYTEQPLHTEAFRHGSFYTQKLAHTEAFTRRSRYTEQLLHTETFALHTEAFRHRSFYKEKLLHKAKFAVHHMFSSCVRAAKRFGPGSSSSSRFAFYHTFAQRTISANRCLAQTNFAFHWTFRRPTCCRIFAEVCTAPAKFTFSYILPHVWTSDTHDLCRGYPGTSTICILPHVWLPDVHDLRRGPCFDGRPRGSCLRRDIQELTLQVSRKTFEGAYTRRSPTCLYIGDGIDDIEDFVGVFEGLIEVDHRHVYMRMMWVI